MQAGQETGSRVSLAAPDSMRGFAIFT